MEAGTQSLVESSERSFAEIDVLGKAFLQIWSKLLKNTYQRVLFYESCSAATNFIKIK